MTRGYRACAAMAAFLPITTISAQTKIPVPEAPSVNMVLIPVPKGADIEAVLPKVIEQAGATQGGIAQHAKPVQATVEGKTVRIETVSFNKAPGVGFFFLSVPQGSGICMAAIPLAQSKEAARPTGTACVKALGKNSGGGSAAAATPAPPPRQSAPQSAPAASASPSAHAGNWANVSGVYFRSLASFGVGGMMVMKFFPLILFKDGSYFEIEDTPLEDIDLAASRAAKPRDWGRWSRKGNTFFLTDDKGKTNDYDLQQGNFFQAFPASPGTTLAGSYKTISGGGNTAFGGDVMIASQGRYTFLPGGVFSTERSTGAMNSGASTGVGSTVAANKAGRGRFSVDRYTLVVTHANGRQERSFFAFGSEKTPPRLDRDMIFIGDSVYTLDD